MSEKLTTINKYAKVIANRPNTKNEFFFIDEPGNKMIIDIAKLKDQPECLHPLHCKQRAVLMIDLEDRAQLRYFGFDIDDPLKETIKNEKDGHMAWTDEIEVCVLKFFEENIRELCLHTNPAEELEKIILKHSNTGTSYHTQSHNSNSQWTSQREARHSNSYDYSHVNQEWANRYKEREDFLEPLYKLIKEGKTGAAIEYVSTKLDALFQGEKVDTIEQILRFVDLGKLDIMTSIQLLQSVQERIKSRTEYNDLYGKVLAYLNKTKPAFTIRLLKGLEFKNIEKSNVVSTAN